MMIDDMVAAKLVNFLQSLDGSLSKAFCQSSQRTQAQVGVRRGLAVGRAGFIGLL